jgi:hypothetical protein
MVFQGIISRHRRILGKLAEKIHQPLDAEKILMPRKVGEFSKKKESHLR